MLLSRLKVGYEVIPKTFLQFVFNCVDRERMSIVGSEFHNLGSLQKYNYE